MSKAGKPPAATDPAAQALAVDPKVAAIIPMGDAPMAAYTPPSLVVRWEDGSCGDALNDAKALLKADVEESGRRLLGWDIGGAEVDTEAGDKGTPGFSKRLLGYEGDNLNKPIVQEVRHMRRTVRPLVDVEERTQERWVRLTTNSGPCAVEVLVTQGGKVVERRKYHPEDMRDISARYAARALQEFGG